MTKLLKTKSVVDDFLAKAANRNEPFEAYIESEAFDRFYQMFKSGIRKQAAWVAGEIQTLDFLDQEATDDNIEDMMAAFGTWLFRYMPAMGVYVSETKVYTSLKYAFEYSVKAQLQRYGFVTKAVEANYVDFELTNKNYIAALKNQANYLLSQKSKIDETTRRQLIATVRDAKLIDNATIDEIAGIITSDFDGISEVRAMMIANTENNQAMSTAQKAFLKENDVPSKRWVAAGPNPDEDCTQNEDQGFIGIDDLFDSGDDAPPAHINCHCYLDGGEIDLNAVEIWGGN